MAGRNGIVAGLSVSVLLAAAGWSPARAADWVKVTEDDRAIKVETDQLEAVIPKRDPKQWMTGIEKGSFLDKSTGFREVGDGLMVVDWLLEAGSDAAWPGDQPAAASHTLAVSPTTQLRPAMRHPPEERPAAYCSQV